MMPEHWLTSSLTAALVLTAAPYASAQGYQELAVAQHAETWRDIFAIDSQRGVEHVWQREQDGDWVGVEELGGTASDLAAVDIGDGRYEVFVVGSDTAVWHNWQPAGDVSWSGWESLGAQAQRVAVARSDAGRYELFVIGSDGAVWHRGRDGAEGEFGDWRSLGGVGTQLTASAAVGGGFAVAVIGSDAAVWYLRLDAGGEPLDDADADSGWQSLGAQATDLALAHSPDSLELVVTGSDGGVWQASRTQSGWSDWEPLGIPARRVALIGVGPSLDLFVLGSDDAVSRAQRPSAAEAWSAAQRIDKASPLDSEFSGKATLEIPSMSVKVSSDVKIGLRFSVNRKQVEVISFPPVTTDSFDTPLGRSNSTVSLAASQEGTFDPGSGQLHLPVTLHFDQSLDLPFIDEDGDLALNLDSTGPGGTSLDRDSGKIALGSSGSFNGGGTNPLDGAACQLLLTGALSSLP